MKKFLVCLLCLFLVGCTKPTINTEIKDEVTITVWNNYAGYKQELFQQLVDDFNSDNKLINVVYQHYSITDYYNNLNSANSPNIYYLDYFDNVDNNVLLDLNEYINNNKIGLNDNVKFIDSNYRLPFCVNCQFFYYNPLLIEYKSDWNKLDKNIQDVQTTLKIKGFETDDVIGLFITQLIQKEALVDNKIDINKVDDVINFFIDYYSFQSNNHSLIESIQNNQVASVVTYDCLETTNLLVDTLPTYNNKPYFSNQLETYVINNKTEQENLASYYFLKYLLDTNTQSKWCTKTNTMSVLKQTNDVYNQYLENDPFGKVLNKYSNNVKFVNTNNIQLKTKVYNCLQFIQNNINLDKEKIINNSKEYLN